MPDTALLLEDGTGLLLEDGDTGLLLETAPEIGGGYWAPRYWATHHWAPRYWAPDAYINPVVAVAPGATMGGPGMIGIVWR